MIQNAEQHFRVDSDEKTGCDDEFHFNAPFEGETATHMPLAP